MESQTEHVKVAVDVMMHEILVLKMCGLELLVLYGVLCTYKMENDPMVIVWLNLRFFQTEPVKVAVIV